MDGISKIIDLANKHGKYPPNAYLFIFEVLQRASEIAKHKRHLTAKELTSIAFTHSVKQFGGLAKMVWEEFNFKRSEDLGEVVFHLVNENLMGAQEEDKQSDFDNLLTIDVFDKVKMRLKGGDTDRWKLVKDESNPLVTEWDFPFS